MASDETGNYQYKAEELLIEVASCARQGHITAGPGCLVLEAVLKWKPIPWGQGDIVTKEEYIALNKQALENEKIP